MASLLEYSKKHPVRMVAGAIGLSALVYGAIKLLEKDASSAGTSADIAGAQQGEAVRITAQVLAELGVDASSIMSSDEAAIIGEDFITLAKQHGKKRDGSGDDDDGYYLDFEAALNLFKALGIKDEAVAASIFNTWDADRSGEVSLKEFVMTLLLTLRGTRTAKLQSVFRILDLDGDHAVSQLELARFMTVVDGLNGVRRSPTERRKEVEAMFALYPTKRIGYLTKEEFLHLASSNKHKLGQHLESFFDDLQKKFSVALAEGAATGKQLTSPKGFAGGAAAAGEGFKA